MTDKERITKAMGRYRAAAHAVQSGVMLDHSRGGEDGSPKHLRTGVNLALVDSAALAKLLINKGVFTEVEYHEALADATEAEQRRYEARLGVGLR